MGNVCIKRQCICDGESDSPDWKCDFCNKDMSYIGKINGCPYCEYKKIKLKNKMGKKHVNKTMKEKLLSGDYKNFDMF